MGSGECEDENERRRRFVRMRMKGVPCHLFFFDSYHPYTIQKKHKKHASHVFPAFVTFSRYVSHVHTVRPKTDHKVLCHLYLV